MLEPGRRLDHTQEQNDSVGVVHEDGYIAYGGGLDIALNATAGTHGRRSVAKATKQYIDQGTVHGIAHRKVRMVPAEPTKILPVSITMFP